MIIFFFLVVMPIAELAVLISAGGAIGIINTLVLVLITAFVGTILLRQQGISTLVTAQHRMQRGEMPAQEMMEGAALVLAGALLLTPGFITDGIGFALLMPPIRKRLIAYLVKRFGEKARQGFVEGQFRVYTDDGFHSDFGAPPTQHRGVIEAERVEDQSSTPKAPPENSVDREKPF